MLCNDCNQIWSQTAQNVAYKFYRCVDAFHKIFKFKMVCSVLQNAVFWTSDELKKSLNFWYVISFKL